MKSPLFAVGVLLCVSGAASAQMRITEYMYNGPGGELIEFTNVGAGPIDMTGWSYDDDSRIPGSVDLSAFGVVAPGQSVLLVEDLATNFIVNWGLESDFNLIDGLTVNLGRNDEINLFDASSNLVDRLTFGDQNFPGSIRANGASGWVSRDGLGMNDPYAYTLSTVGDFQNSWTSLLGEIGSPGRHIIPEPVTLTLLAAGLALFRRRRN